MDIELHTKILGLLASHGQMALATLREDGFPQVTTVNYVNDGLAIYFYCSANSQKARNLARDARVSLAINRDCTDWSNIQGLSLGGTVERLTEIDEIAGIAELFIEKFAHMAGFDPEDFLGSVYFRIHPKVVSVLDYTKGFGHRDLVEF